MSYDLNKLTRLQALQDLATRIQAKFNALESSDVSLKGVAVSGNSLKFFTSTDTSSTPAFSIDLPAEMFLDSVSTGLVPNFAFSAATYEGATDPNLNGKPVLVLGVKTRNNDGISETISYSFLDMSTLVDVYTASDTSVVIADYKVKVNVSADSDNMLATTANGLYVDGSGKVDKVVGTVGNVVIFAADGAVSDTGIAIATNAEVTEMLDAIFGSVINGKSVSFASTSDFFSTDPTTFHTLLQTAWATNSSVYESDTSETAMMIFADDGTSSENLTITFGDFKTLIDNSNATFQDFVNLLNTKLTANNVQLTISYTADTQTMTITNTSGNESISFATSPGIGDFAGTIFNDIGNSNHTEGENISVDEYGLAIEVGV